MTTIVHLQNNHFKNQLRSTAQEQSPGGEWSVAKVETVEPGETITLVMSPGRQIILEEIE
jgi:hypothetical protein